jgi:tetratricopeptide (TPR) repeat protein
MATIHAPQKDALHADTLRPPGLKTAGRRELLALGGALLAIEAAVFWAYAQIGGYGFITYDDPSLVYGNPLLLGGLSLKTAVPAFTSFYTQSWHPLTWLSMMLDVQLFGMNAHAFHLVNLGFHMGSILLVFAALSLMTGKPWRCAAVTGIFALHPLQVEGIAWASERKDALSVFLGALTLLLYVRYTGKPSLHRYLATVAAFTAGLMAKSMLITLPCVLLLLDVWPLRRLSWPWQKPLDRAAWRRALLEKAPLLLLSAGCSALTAYAHLTGKQLVISRMPLPLAAHAANAVVSYPAYLRNTFDPLHLALLYPYHPPAPETLLASLTLLLALSAGALKTAASRPYLLVGWLWFLGMILPVSGVLISGDQAMADRYMHLPLIGLSLSLVWLCADAAEKLRLPQPVSGMGMAALLAVLAVLTHRQAAYWKDNVTLYGHALEVTSGNAVMAFNLGAVYAAKGEPGAAIPYFTQAIDAVPDFAEAHNSLGVALGQSGRPGEALKEFARTEQLRGGRDADAENNLCFTYFRMGRKAEAVAHCETALRLDPGFAPAAGTLKKLRGGNGGR